MQIQLLKIMNKKLLTILLLAVFIFLFYDIGIVDYQSLIGNITTSHKLPKVRPIILATSLSQGSTSLSQGSMSLSQGKMPSSQVSTSLSQGSASLSQGLTSLSQGSASLSQGLTSLSQGSASLSQGLTSLSQGSASLSQGSTSLSQGSMSLSQGKMPSSQVSTSLSQGSASLSQGLTSLSQGSASLSQGLTSLSQGSASLSQGLTSLSQGLTSLSQGSASLSQGLTSLSQGSASLSQGSASLSQGLTPLSQGSASLSQGMCKANVTAEEYDRLFPRNGDKYIFASWSGSCGGLANQIWRYASMYGIGKPFGRKPIFKEDQKCNKTNWIHETDGDHEIEQLFPIYFSQIKYIKEQEKANETFYAKGPKDNPPMHVIANVTEKYVKIDGAAFHHSDQFFKNRRTEMRQIFQFGHAFCKTVEAYQKELFGNDSAHKFCVHTRLGDFKNYHWETKKDFTEQGIEFGCKYLKDKFDYSNISVVLLGEEKQFLLDLTFNRQLIANVYVPKAMSRGDDLAFATTACDSLLITAVTSTYSW